jgi:hypothetical protein
MLFTFTIITVAQTDPSKDNQLDFKVWKVFSPDSKGFTVVILSLNAKHFNHTDMKVLALKLNAEFAQNDKLRVGILDDANSARLFVTGGLEIPEYNKAERGRYYLDRTKCREYIRYSTARGKPVNMVKISIGCQRKRDEAIPNGLSNKRVQRSAKAKFP